VRDQVAVEEPEYSKGKYTISVC